MRTNATTAKARIRGRSLRAGERHSLEGMAGYVYSRRERLQTDIEKAGCWFLDGNLNVERDGEDQDYFTENELSNVEMRRMKLPSALVEYIQYGYTNN